MNSAPYVPHAPQDPATHAETGSSLHLVAGLAIGLAGGALACALLLWARPHQPKPWHGRIRDALTEQVRQLQKIAAAVAHEIERA